MGIVAVRVAFYGSVKYYMKNSPYWLRQWNATPPLWLDNPGETRSERLVRPSRIFVWDGTFIMEMLTVAKTRRVMDS
jgi:hypothetical protein